MRRRADAPPADSALRTDHLRGDLAGRTIRGGAVTMGAQGLKVIAQFAVVVLLARLLTPTDFGVFAIVMALLNVLELFKDLGLSSATVQRAEISERQVSTLFWLNCALGLTVALLLGALGPVLALVYDERVLTQITPAVAISLAVTGVAAQHMAILRRQMRFATLAYIQTGAELAGMAAAVAAAFAGFGIWSLVVQRLVWSGVTLICAWIMTGWRPSRPGTWGEVRSLVAFGGTATVSMVLGNSANNLYKLLIGWYWGAAPLGLFERAQRLVMMPVRNVNGPLATVALPVLSLLQNDPERYRRTYLKFVERIAMVMAPVVGLTVAASEPVVDLVLGDQWHDAAPILGWLGLTLFFMPLTYTLSWLYMSQDRTPEMLRAGIINTTITFAAFAVALPFGAVAVAASIALSGLLVRLPVLLWLAGRRGPVTPRDFATALVTPIAGGCAAIAAILSLGTVPEIADLAVWAEVAIYGVAACAAALSAYALIPRGRLAIAEIGQLPSMLWRRATA